MADHNFTREKTYTPHRLDGRNPAPVNKSTLIIGALILVLVLAMAGYGAVLFMSTTAPIEAPGLPTEYFENIFVDVNGDGLPDYIVRMEVILNPGNPLSPAPQP